MLISNEVFKHVLSIGQGSAAADKKGHVRRPSPPSVLIHSALIRVGLLTTSPKSAMSVLPSQCPDSV